MGSGGYLQDGERRGVSEGNSVGGADGTDKITLRRFSVRGEHIFGMIDLNTKVSKLPSVGHVRVCSHCCESLTCLHALN